LGDFYDLCIVTNTESLHNFLERAFRLGYKGVGVSGLSISTRDRLEIDSKVEVVSRLDLYFDKNIQAKRVLRRERRNFEIIVAHPKNVNTARFSARDGRIDIVNFHGHEYLFSPIQAKLMANEGKALEICLSHLRTLKKLNPRPLTRIIRKYYVMLTLAEEFGVDVVCSSGATNLYEMLSPKDVIAFISILGLGNKAAQALTKAPREILERNRLKLSDKFILPGVMLLDE